MKADTVSRTALIGVHDGGHSSMQDALAAHASTGLAIVADSATCRQATGQAALCTAIATAARAFGTVAVITDTETVLTAGPYRGRSIGEVLVHEGVDHAVDLRTVPGHWPVLLLGPATTPPSDGGDHEVVLRATWTGWTAHVQRAGTPVPEGRSGTVLAAIAAAALGVHESFGAVRNRPGSDAGYRTCRLNLWRPGTDLDEGPELTYAPAAWWLVGLGHLGQANAWVISWLSYSDPTTIPIVLQDTDWAVPANHSTGLLTPTQPPRIRKPRIIAAALDRLGFDTYIVERRLDPASRTAEGGVHVALIGVDNLPSRRLISTVGWPLAIDASLGTGAADFNAILLRRFPAALTSDQVPGWADQPAIPSRPVDTAPFDESEDRDPCGMAELAGTAVGAAFVGAVAGCLAATEAIRAVYGVEGYDVVNLHLNSADASYAPATKAVDVVAARLSDPC